MAGEANLVFFSRQKSPKCALGGGDVPIMSWIHCVLAHFINRNTTMGADMRPP